MSADDDDVGHFHSEEVKAAWVRAWETEEAAKAAWARAAAAEVEALAAAKAAEAKETT